MITTFVLANSNSIRESGNDKSAALWTNLITPLMLTSNSLMNKILWIKSFNLNVFEFLVQVLLEYLKKYDII